MSKVNTAVMKKARKESFSVLFYHFEYTSLRSISERGNIRNPTAKLLTACMASNPKPAAIHDRVAARSIFAISAHIGA